MERNFILNCDEKTFQILDCLDFPYEDKISAFLRLSANAAVCTDDIKSVVCKFNYHVPEDETNIF